MICKICWKSVYVPDYYENTIQVVVWSIYHCIEYIVLDNA